MLAFVASAHAQEVPEGDFESTGSHIGWTAVVGAANNVDEIHSDIRNSRVLVVDRGSGALVVCSLPFTVTRVGASALMHNPYDTDDSDWWVEDAATGTELGRATASPSSGTSNYSIHQLDVQAACGVEVVLCVEPEPYTQIDYDNFALAGAPCPEYDDVDEDGTCPDGLDLDLDGDCASAGEFDAGVEDCDDLASGVHPGQVETCDGVDEDCDLLVDEDFDLDQDGWATCANDCDDAEPAVNPGVVEVCNAVDDDCDGVVDQGFDQDGDGVTTCADDCDDRDGSAFPGALEVCDGADDDCDGQVDDGLIVTWWPDADRDGYGDAGAEPTTSCDPPVRSALTGDDCDDQDPDVHPGAPDVDGDGEDLDCDGTDGVGVVHEVDRSPSVEPLPPVGCACDQGGSPGAAAGFALLVAIGRRRRSGGPSRAAGGSTCSTPSAPDAG